MEASAEDERRRIHTALRIHIASPLPHSAPYSPFEISYFRFEPIWLLIPFSEIATHAVHFLCVTASVTHPPMRLYPIKTRAKLCFLMEDDDAKTASENLLALQCMICWPKIGFHAKCLFPG